MLTWMSRRRLWSVRAVLRRIDASEAADFSGRDSKDATTETETLWQTVAIRPLHRPTATILQLHLANQTNCFLVRLSETKHDTVSALRLPCQLALVANSLVQVTEILFYISGTMVLSSKSRKSGA